MSVLVRCSARSLLLGVLFASAAAATAATATGCGTSASTASPGGTLDGGTPDGGAGSPVAPDACKKGIDFSLRLDSTTLAGVDATDLTAGTLASGAHPALLTSSLKQFGGETGELDVFGTNGAGHLLAPVSYLEHRSNLKLGDVDGDALPDLFTSTRNGSQIYLNRASGTLTKAPYVSKPLSQGWDLGDVNGDGKQDLVFETPSSVDNGHKFTISVMLSKGDGTFAAEVAYLLGSSTYNETWGDFDGDGKLDVIANDIFTNAARMLHGNGDGTYVETPLVVPATDDVRPISVDLNGDHRTDLLYVAGPAGAYTVTPLLGKGDGTFTTGATFTVPVKMTPVIADLDGDGFTDLFFWSSDTTTVHGLLFSGRGDGTFGEPAGVNVPGTGPLVAVDLDGDQRPDLAVVTNVATVGAPVMLATYKNRCAP
jgi:hypothetical protein